MGGPAGWVQSWVAVCVCDVLCSGGVVVLVVVVVMVLVVAVVTARVPSHPHSLTPAGSKALVGEPGSPLPRHRHSHHSVARFATLDQLCSTATPPDPGPALSKTG